MLNRTKNLNSELEARFIQDRIALVERHVAELCQAFGAYSRKAARLRDRGDDLARSLLAYSESEAINRSLSDGMARCARAFGTVCDYADKRVNYIDAKVVGELAVYEGICKKVKEDVKMIFVARDKELGRKRQLDKVRDRNPRSRQQIVQAETELVQATAEVSRTIHGIEEQITTFERQKLHDLKTILSTFLLTEIGYHAKAMEYLTIAYQEINNVDEETDLQEFRKSLHLPDKIPHARKSLFTSSANLGSLGNIFHGANKKPPPGIIGKNPSRLTKSENALDKIEGGGEDDDEEEETLEESDEESETDDTTQSNTKQQHVSPFVAKRYLK